MIITKLKFRGILQPGTLSASFVAERSTFAVSRSNVIAAIFSTMRILLGCFICLLSAVDARTAIMPPPWADPSSNPCAAQPRGWQLLYWPADGKCYKIFQVGVNLLFLLKSYASCARRIYGMRLL